MFNAHGFECFRAPYESDFQLVHWENIGLTDGTFTIDSDIFAVGSSTMIDLLAFSSAIRKCKILLKDKVQGEIMADSDTLDMKHVLFYSAMSQCDFIPRLF